MKQKAKTAVAFLIVFGVLLGGVIARNLRHNSHAAALDYSKALNSGLPVLMEFGRGTCEPCKAMMPILAELNEEYSSAFAVGYIDTRENPDLAEAHEIQMIPAQVFFDANGMELFRHVGFYPKEDILAKWLQLGVEVEEKE